MVRVLQIGGDEWEGVRDRAWTIANPSRRDLDRVIGRLDARTFTMITLDGEGGHYLAVGGGDGRYVVYATFGNEEFWNLIGDDVSGGTVALNVGGQEGDYPVKLIVDLERARAAANAFLVELVLDSALRWEKQ